MNILHRDIKPTNILFSGRGTVKLSEFAVAGDSVGAIGDTFMGSFVYYTAVSHSLFFFGSLLCHRSLELIIP
jgi:serine/threonine protein kinase